MKPGEPSLTADQIAALCRRGFGTGFQIESIRELGGGTLNSVYLITSMDQDKVVLRVAPRQTAGTYWEESLLMRREHAMQPYFAPIAPLMPRTLQIDFTHQLIDRDYMFQTFIDGERWDEVMDELTEEENNLLWEQFGSILKQIHNVQGEAFGLPLPGLLFPAWNQYVIERLERTMLAAKEDQREVPHLGSILEFIRSHPRPLDEFQVPRLLHGDLWTFNILVRRGPDGPSINGVLDADRAWWGDPLADWTMFILSHAEEEEGHSHFWQAYGRPEETPGTPFRVKVYDAMHAATAFLWAFRHQDEGTITRARGTLGDVAKDLRNL